MYFSKRQDECSCSTFLSVLRKYCRSDGREMNVISRDTGQIADSRRGTQ
jgi:hypothetical protein